MLTHTGVAPGTTAGACGGLGNAADAVDHSAGTHHSSNSGRNRSNDLAGDAAIVSLRGQRTWQQVPGQLWQPVRQGPAA